MFCHVTEATTLKLPGANVIKSSRLHLYRDWGQLYKCIYSGWSSPLSYKKKKLLCIPSYITGVSCSYSPDSHFFGIVGHKHIILCINIIFLNDFNKIKFFINIILMYKNKLYGHLKNLPKFHRHFRIFRIDYIKCTSYWG